MLGKGIWFVCVRGRIILYSLLVTLMALLGWKLLYLPYIPTNLNYTELVSGKTVVIDPGHGGKDPGKVGIGGVLEKDITLQVALHLEKLLNKAGINTIMARTDDRDLADPNARNRKAQDLARRVELANRPEVDIFVSLHANSYPTASISGAQVFYFAQSELGKLLAQSIQDSFKQSLPPNRRTVMTGDYYVLVQSKVPAVVVEMGFLSNPTETQLMKEPSYQKKLAEVICQGILGYFASVNHVVSLEKESEHLPLLLATEDKVYAFFVNSKDPQFSLEAVEYLLKGEEKHYSLDAKATIAINQLLAGPRDSSGLVRVIPSGVKLNSLVIDESVAYLDFSPEMKENFQGGGGEEELIIQSLLSTMGQFEEIKEVYISIDNFSEVSIGGHIYLGNPFLVPHRN